MQLKFPLLTIFQHEDWQKSVLRFFFLKNLLQLLTFPDFQSPALMCSHKTSLVLTCATVQSGQPVRNHLNIREGVRIIHQTEIKDTDTHTHTPIHFWWEVIHIMAWQRKFSSDSFMEGESSPSSLCHFLSNTSSVSWHWILACWLQPALIISLPV